VHIILDMIGILFLIGIPNDSIQESTGKVNTIDSPCNVSLRNSERPEALFSSEYSVNSITSSKRSSAGLTQLQFDKSVVLTAVTAF